MRDGDPECRLRLGDRVQWWVTPDELIETPATVIGLKRKFWHSPNVAIDEVQVVFDERVHLIDGMEGLKKHWFAGKDLQLKVTAAPEPEGEDEVANLVLGGPCDCDNGEVHQPSAVPGDEGWYECPVCGGSEKCPTAEEIAELRNELERIRGDLMVAERLNELGQCRVCGVGNWKHRFGCTLAPTPEPGEDDVVD